MSEMAINYGKESSTMTKIQKHKWTVKDQPGELRMLSKSVIQIHPDYQRDLIESKVREFASSWSWVACGAIIVGHRDGAFWGIDGQHRVAAAKRRADIQFLPCLVFETSSVEQEARGFLDANTGRKPVKSIDKFRASLASGDETSQYVDSVFKALGVTTSACAKRPMEIKSVAWSLASAKENRQAFEDVVRLAAELCHDQILHEILLGGLYYLRINAAEEFLSKRMHDRILKIGASRLIDSAKRASAYFTRGGAKVWADGMLSEINKGLRSRMEIGSQASSQENSAK